MTPEHALPALYRQKERRRQLAVGTFVLGGLLVAGTLLFILTDPAIFRGRYYLDTVVEDAGGVRRGDPVQMRGVNIGRIRGFDIQPDGVRLELEISDEFRVPAGSRVSLTSGGLLGGRVASIIPGEGQEVVPKGATLPGRSAAEPLADVGQIADQATQSLERVQALLNEQTVQNIQSGTQSAQALLDELEGMAKAQRDEIQRLVTNLRQASEGLAKVTTGPELERSVRRLDQMTKTLDGAVAKLNRSATSLETVMGRIERGEGTLGRLSRDDTLYVGASRAAANIDQSATELRQLIEDVRKNPRRYLNLEIF